MVALLAHMRNLWKPSLVGSFVMGILNREVGDVELIPVAKGVISRWWIVLFAALLGTVAMWSQESDLSTTPTSIEVVRIYESRDETALLSLVGINPATVSPFPSFEHQVLQIQEYQFQLQEIRKQSVISGLDRLQLLLESLSLNTTANSEKITALKAAKPLIKGELALLSTTITGVGATISTVKPSTYGFGFAGGALIGLLVALQLTLIDKRVRSISQLSKRFEARALLGTATREPASIQHIAAAIVARAQALSLTSIALVPVDEQTVPKNLTEQIHAVTSPMGVSAVSLRSISSLSANDMISSSSGMIAVASHGVSLMEDIVATWSVLENAQKPVLGVILADSDI